MSATLDVRGCDMFVPLVDLDSTESASAIVGALQTSGFLLLKSPLLPPTLLQRALAASKEVLLSPDAAKYGVQEHTATPPQLPDPKRYALRNYKELPTLTPAAAPTSGEVLTELYDAMEEVKLQLLTAMAVGLNLNDPSCFIKLHQEKNNTLRLLHYLPVSETQGNRCKEHSDYGSVTLLLTDGSPGLEAFNDKANRWVPVPHVEGAVVVNIGSLMSAWTKGSLRATLHRVAGPASQASDTEPEELRQAC
eukprot:CAMPEP_0118946852 /NCGR_PEP_ID=MMETSP1169-20130426/44946_1 /TAXON_ID=36882 /ORGANISM="Pyramimonas obovata, Strain CCMP722" /LENGTH=249 /DNA_ID=CAMNT_0006892933 /DNA_START=197 /DNA_END=943 /DNA_ORIENTATION=-